MRFDPSAVHTAQAFLERPETQPPIFLVEGIVPERSIVMLCAPPGHGKTMLALAAGIAVSSGTAFLNRSVTQAPVLVFGEDAPPWDYGSQLRRLLGRTPPPDDLHVVTSTGLRILDPDDRSTLQAYVHKHHIRLLVLDTLRAVHDGDENDSAHMQGVMNVLRGLTSDCQLTVLFLHHTAKANWEHGKPDYRGSSVILGSSDFHIQLSARTSTPFTSHLRLGIPKGRGPDVPQVLNAILTWDADSAVITPSAADPMEHAILARLQGGEATLAELTDLVGANGGTRSQSTVDRVIQRLRLAGRVGAAGKRGRAQLYVISS